MFNASIHPNHKRFAETFVRLWRDQKARGVLNPRVGRLAALASGYGNTSWCEGNAIQTADVMFNKLVKRPEIVQYIRELGLERVGRQWREIDRAEPA
jgi:hypothetical protein